MSVVHVSRLVRRYEGHPGTGLDGVDLEIAPGSIAGLVGPNGAGKTTLLGVIATLLTPTSGTVTVLRHDVVADAAAVRGLVGFAPDNARAFYGRLSARDNLRLFGSLHGRRGPLLNRRIEALAERFGARAFLDLPLQACSAGTRQKFNLARALLHEPTLLLLDEPLQGIDAASAAGVLDYLEREWPARETGAAIVTAPRADELPSICTDVIRLEAGRLVGSGARGGA
ncbi:MAG TPA: ABC transporter ATP-binding protein [Vicinamibacterales bacterium]|nr:ABC transporter ATP-binding protein [Vicinamibacterales bacterium]